MNSPDREATGQRIARARWRRGLSQAVLAGLVSRSESWLSQVERGRRVSGRWCWPQ
jgi:ribosome-binding protein aMBF1 (putative translation factor)